MHKTAVRWRPNRKRRNAMSKFFKTISLMLTIAVMIIALGTLVSQPLRATIAAAAVNVVNTAANPVMSRDVDNPATQPIEMELNTTNNVGKYVVPTTTSDGKPITRLVIENISAGNCFSQYPPTGPFGVLAFTTANGGNGGLFSFQETMDVQIPNQVQSHVNTQLTKIYADPGTTVQFFPFSGDCTPVSFSGYFVTN
jgi:hypothetical protein